MQTHSLILALLISTLAVLSYAGSFGAEEKSGLDIQVEILTAKNNALQAQLQALQAQLQGQQPQFEPRQQELKLQQPQVQRRQLSQTSRFVNAEPSNVRRLGMNEALIAWAADPANANVTFLDFNSQLLGGEIPSWIGNFSELVYIDLSGNDLQGPLPQSLGNLSKLKYLYLNNNALSGAIPTSFGRLSLLEELDMTNNKLSGPIPELGGTSLINLWLKQNEFYSEIPVSLGDVTTLSLLDMSSSHLIGSIPSSLGNLQQLGELHLQSNDLSGALPAGLLELDGLRELELSNNRLSGIIPLSAIRQQASMEKIKLDANKLEGPIPESLCNFKKLSHLSVSSNKLSGSIPLCIGNFSEMTYLSLNDNQLSGSIPDSVGGLKSMQFLKLNGNQLTGSIPSSFGLMSDLQFVTLSANKLSGSIPASFGNLKNMWNLNLYLNELSGIIPLSLGNATALSTLYLAGNQLTGGIPETFSNLENLVALQLHSNLLSGAIPNIFAKMASLLSLRLDRNQLSGSIPDMSGLKHLSELLLSENGLSGTIPSTLGSLRALSNIDLSYNNLEGIMPDLSATSVQSLRASFNQISDVSSFNWTTLVTLDLSGNRLIDASFIRNLTELRSLSLAFNSITNWPRAGTYPRAYVNLVPGFSGTLDLPEDSGKFLFDEAFSLSKLSSLNLSHNPIWANFTQPDHDILAFVNSISYLPQLALVDASACNLTGNLPYIMAATGTNTAVVDKQIFPNLVFLSLGRNKITQISAPIPRSLLVVDLSSNSLGVGVDAAQTILESSWWKIPRQLKVSQNPQLRVSVTAPNITRGCNSAITDLQADPFGFRVLTSLETVRISSTSVLGVSLDQASVECTSACRVTDTDFNVDFGMLNLTSLCRCKVGWEGVGANCTSCAINYFGFWDSGRQASVCKACPATSSKSGLTAQSGITSCRCTKGNYLQISVDGSTGVCNACEPGSFSSSAGEVGGCTACPFGTASNLSGATACTECLEGYFATSSSGALSCALCPAGKFQSNKMQTQCSSCFAGSFSVEGSILCQLCPKGTYQSSTGSGSCLSCANGFITAETGSDNASKCICPANTYFKDNACHPCTNGIDCPGGLNLFTVLPGYYSTGPDASLIFKCSPEDGEATQLCGGGAQQSDCLGRRIGFLCQKCPTGTSSSAKGTCEDCSSGNFVLIISLAAIAVLVLVVMLLAALRSPVRQLPQMTEVKSSAALVIQAVQTLAALDSIGMQWAEPFKTLLRGLSFFSIDLDIIHIRCVIYSDSFGNFLLRLAIPLIGLIGLAIGGLAINLLKRGRVVTADALISVSGQIFVGAYISICLVSVAAFHCFVHPNLRSSLVIYPTVLCWEPGIHHQMVGFSIAAIVLYVAGLFAMVTYVIWQYPKVIMRDSLSFIRRFGFLFANWSPGCYWFSYVVLTRNLFVAVLPRIIPIAYNQITLVLIQFALMVHLCFVLRTSPWRSSRLNRLDIIFCALFQVILAGAIIFSFKRELTEPISYAIFALCILNFLLGLAYMATKLWSSFARTMQYAFFVSHHKAGGACTARLLKTLLTMRLEREIFYDSDNLNDLSGIVNAVKVTECLIVLLTGETLCRPWCAAEIITAAQLGVPFIPMTVGNSADDERDFKDRYQTLNAEGLEQLLKNFEVLKPHGVDVDATIDSYELLLGIEPVHLNLLDEGDVNDILQRLIVSSRGVGREARKWWTSKRTSITRMQEVAVTSTRSSISIGATDSHVSIGPTESTGSGMRSGFSVSKIRSTLGVSKSRSNLAGPKTKSGKSTFEVEGNNRWIIMTDSGDFEATAAARYVKINLQRMLQTEIVLDVELSNMEFQKSVESYSVFLWFLSLRTLSSAPQLSRLTLLTILRSDCVIKPVLITDAFRFPDEVFYQSFEEGQSFGPNPAELFSRLAGREVSCDQVIAAIRSVFHNISSFIHVPVASESLLQTSIAEMVMRLKAARKAVAANESWSPARKTTSHGSREMTMRAVRSVPLQEPSMASEKSLKSAERSETVSEIAGKSDSLIENNMQAVSIVQKSKTYEMRITL